VALAGLALALLGVKKPANPCKGGLFYEGFWNALGGWILRGGSGKGLVFEMAAGEQLKRPYLLGLGANFVGLVMVRSEVSDL
jgi:hypothetical protein